MPVQPVKIGQEVNVYFEVNGTINREDLAVFEALKAAINKLLK